MVKRTGSLRIRIDGEFRVRLPRKKTRLLILAVLILVILRMTGDSTVLPLFL